jgi:hypothetical protein
VFIPTICCGRIIIGAASCESVRQTFWASSFHKARIRDFCAPGALLVPPPVSVDGLMKSRKLDGMIGLSRFFLAVPHCAHHSSAG